MDLKDILTNTLQDLWSIKYNISQPTFLEILKKVNNGQLPIYEISQKELKRIL